MTCLHLFAYRKAWEWSAGLAVNLEIIYLRSREHILKSYTNPTRTVSLLDRLLTRRESVEQNHCMGVHTARKKEGALH